MVRPRPASRRFPGLLIAAQLAWALVARAPACSTIQRVITRSASGGSLPIALVHGESMLPFLEDVEVDIGEGAGDAKTMACLNTTCVKPVRKLVPLPPNTTLFTPEQQAILQACRWRQSVRGWVLSQPAHGKPPRCAVVGGGGALSGSGCGHSVDSNDLIFRINRAPFTGYERDVGSRTDVHIMNEHWLALLSKGIVRSGQVLDVFSRYGRVPDTSRRAHFLLDAKADCPRQLAAWKCANPLRHRFPFVPERWSAWCIPNGLKTELAEVNMKAGGKWPTTGLIAVLLASLLCREVNVYGMVDDTTGAYSYYARSTEAISNMHWHNFSAEHRLLDRWVQEGVSTGRSALHLREQRAERASIMASA